VNGERADCSMAPKDKQREASIERTTEYDEFLDELAKYHEKRGCVFHLRIAADPWCVDNDS
jgi:hypothetical protein